MVNLFQNFQNIPRQSLVNSSDFIQISSATVKSKNFVSSFKSSFYSIKLMCDTSVKTWCIHNFQCKFKRFVWHFHYERSNLQIKILKLNWVEPSYLSKSLARVRSVVFHTEAEAAVRNNRFVKYFKKLTQTVTLMVLVSKK